MASTPTPLSTTDFETARNKLADEITLLHSLWHEYHYLYDSGTDRVEMLNFCASWFFGLTQRVFIREILLGIARLTDPVTTAGFDNLTIAALLRDPALKPTSETAVRLKQAVDNAVRLADPIRAHRNKYIAHLDQNLALAKATPTLPEVRYTTVTDALAALETAFNEHALRLRNSQLDFEVKALKAAAALVAILLDSERWKRWQAQERENPSF